MSFSSVQRQYTVTSSINFGDDAVAPIASFPERLDLISHDGAFDYGELGPGFYTMHIGVQNRNDEKPPRRALSLQ
jgi:hypothetical protein